MTYTLAQAVKATGKSKSTIFRAITGGKLSATRDEVSNGWLIEPSELHRLFPPVSETDRHGDEPRKGKGSDQVLHRENELLREMIVNRDGVIDDLRRRLDAEGEERRKLTAILTDQRAKAPDVIVTPPPTSDHEPAKSPLTVLQSTDDVKRRNPASTNNDTTAPAAAMKPPPIAKRKGWRRLFG